MKLQNEVKLIFILSTIFLISCTQEAYLTKLEKPLSPDELSLKIVQEINLDKDRIFDLSLEWIAKTFVSSKAVIEYQDKNTGKIIGHGQISYTLKPMGLSVPIPCNFTLTIETKDNKYRMIFDNFLIGTNSTPISGLYEQDKEQLVIIRSELEDLSNNLYKYMNTTNNDDDW